LRRSTELESLELELPTPTLYNFWLLRYQRINGKRVKLKEFVGDLREPLLFGTSEHIEWRVRLHQYACFVVALDNMNERRLEAKALATVLLVYATLCCGEYHEKLAGVEPASLIGPYYPDILRLDLEVTANGPVSPFVRTY
jgi:hypothetical protein